jgi:molecular chaperone GrpE
MNRRVRVPIRARPSTTSGRAPYADRPEIAEVNPRVIDREETILTDRPDELTSTGRSRRGPSAAPAPQPEPKTKHATRNTDHAPRTTQPAQDESTGIADEESLQVWRDRALRLQAEMENFRKRQRRLAEERILADRERVLRSFLRVADDLERALNADGVDSDSLRQGVDLTHQALMRILDQEGAEPIEALGQPFDPAWHEAVGTVPNGHARVKPDTVVEVVEAGYRMGGRLLRPARVIVAT